MKSQDIEVHLVDTLLGSGTLRRILKNHAQTELKGFWVQFLVQKAADGCCVDEQPIGFLHKLLHSSFQHAAVPPLASRVDPLVRSHILQSVSQKQCDVIVAYLCRSGCLNLIKI